MSIHFSDIEDAMNEGLIFIDTEANIRLYSDKVKDIFGVRRECTYEHEEGTVETGDIIIMATTAFGADDGGLRPRDLKCIGVNPSEVNADSTVLVVGKYGGKENTAYLKTRPFSFTADDFELKRVVDGLDIEIKVSYINKYIGIYVDKVVYENYYNNDFGHMVIIDGLTKKMKFYQSIGYTVWNEDIKSILNGGRFKRKIKGINELDVLGKHILEAHNSSEAIMDLIKCSKGSRNTYRGKITKINGISVLCGVKGIAETGALLLLEDIPRIKNIEKQCNIAYKRLEKVEAKLGDRKVYSKLFPKFVGSSEGIMKIKKLALKASNSNSNLLILGESGTGKTILAREIHEASDNKNKPFIHVNCNSIPENLLESELFGYDRGAFTGANVKGKKGYFEMANGGTLFLDEIGDISKNMQVKLLQVIQSKKFYKVGGNKEINVDVRIIVATNRNLEEEVKEGNFREDLYYRINVFPIHIISLRDRREDIYELVEYLLPKICERVGTELKRISGEALNKLMIYTWPGNIRELENVLERAVNLCDDRNILSGHIKVNVDKYHRASYINYIRPLKKTLHEIEREAIRNVMRYTEGNKKEAMSILKMKKSSFYQKIKNI
ncbi:MAG: sigma-54 dependent transcriptional regulator [Maledivibacter sp.]|jgi:transcriptional regulator with PAS, ATPase and Fis domain|nr:sigma-54 dependent transcriptional regulator [Maledivibacter sp.]